MRPSPGSSSSTRERRTRAAPRAQDQLAGAGATSMDGRVVGEVRHAVLRARDAVPWMCAGNDVALARLRRSGGGSCRRSDTAHPHHARRQPAAAARAGRAASCARAAAKRSTPPRSTREIARRDRARRRAAARLRHRRRQRRRAGARELLHLRARPHERLRRPEPAPDDARPRRTSRTSSS